MITTLALAIALQTPTGIPDELVGRWRFGAINGITYADAANGSYTGDSGGVGNILEFKKDGTYHETTYIRNQANYGWVSTAFVWMEGRFKVKGDTITLTPTKGRHKYTDNQVSTSNYERDMGAEDFKKQTRTYGFYFETEKGKRVFVKGTREQHMTYERMAN